MSENHGLEEIDESSGAKKNPPPENSLLKFLREEFGETFWRLSGLSDQRAMVVAEMMKPFGLSLLDMAVSEKQPGMFIVQLCGGENGPGEWPDYFSALSVVSRKLQKQFKRAWLIRLDNDCPDDIHYVIMGVGVPVMEEE
ncbi:MAG: hypothetical protein J6Y62_06875 [Clostridia bacterium]|nr:hypothetical protein [Clostridia bacterium]